jgi:hypothetical protein
MKKHRILASWFASMLVAGTVAAGAVAPAEAATRWKSSTPTHSHVWHPADTGWGST